MCFLRLPLPWLPKYQIPALLVTKAMRFALVCRRIQELIPGLRALREQRIAGTLPVSMRIDVVVQPVLNATCMQWEYLLCTLA